MKVSVIGAGKMGLPLACAIAKNGANVIACDTKRATVDNINRAVVPFDEPGLPELLRQVVRSGMLRATCDTVSAVAESEVVIVIVPVVLTAAKEADTAAIESASRQVAAGLQKGTLVAYETTLPLGGTRRLLPILESRGLKGGQDFDVVFAPERVKSRFVLQQLVEQPKVIGGLTPRAAERAAAFYRRYFGCDILNVGSLETAEFIKLGGMIYRDVNIALANELAAYAERVDVDLPTVVRAANTDGETFMLEAGIGVGGHCTPVYPHLLMQEARRISQPLPIVELGRRINDQQPASVLRRLERLWGSLAGRRILILGLGFRPEVKEHICSPAFALRDELLRRGAHATLHDPLYSAQELEGFGFKPGTLEDQPGPEVLILNTAHSEYGRLDFGRLAARGLKAVVDGRNLWQPEQVRAAGLLYVGVGRP
jgi:nucleotide sugar dehydrogenase